MVSIFAVDGDGNIIPDSYVFGYINSDFKWAVSPEYSNTYTNEELNYRAFGSSGLAAVKKGDKWGAIDKEGNTVIQFRYEEMQPDEEGLLIFKTNGKYGYMDADTHAVVIEAKYDMVSAFNMGCAVVYDGTDTFLIDRGGQAIPGGGNMDFDAYFELDETDGHLIQSNHPTEYTVITENGKKGYRHFGYHPELPARSEMDDWAYDEAASAIAEELAPIPLQNLYRYDLTRREMCDLLTQTIEKITGTQIREFVKRYTGIPFSEYIRKTEFHDCAEETVVACNALGIIRGDDAGLFHPYGIITREEAAAMLQRTAKVLGLNADRAKSVSVSDQNSIADFFRDAVNYVLSNGIMTCGDDDAFDPQDNITRQEAMAYVYRLLRVVNALPVAD